MAPSKPRKRKHSEKTPIVKLSRTSLRKLDQKLREKFGRFLHSLLKERGWSQSDFAAMLFGRDTDNQSALGRDRISKYITGATFPENETLALMVKVFGMKGVEDLLPIDVLKALEDINSSSIDLQIIPGTDLCRWKASGTYNLEFVRRLIKLCEEFDERG